MRDESHNVGGGAGSKLAKVWFQAERVAMGVGLVAWMPCVDRSVLRASCRCNRANCCCEAWGSSRVAGVEKERWCLGTRSGIGLILAE